MWTAILKLWEAVGGTLGIFVLAFLAYVAAAARGVLRELQDVKDRAKEDRELRGCAKITFYLAYG